MQPGEQTARDILHLQRTANHAGPSSAPFIPESAIHEALSTLEAMRARENGHEVLTCEAPAEPPENRALREEAEAMLHATCGELMAELAHMKTVPIETRDNSAIAGCEQALSDAQAALMQVHNPNIDPQTLLANAEQACRAAQQSRQEGQQTFNLEKGVETAETFSEKYQEHRAQLDQFWREWDAAEVKLSHEISSMARDFNDKYDLDIDVDGYEAQREDLLRQIEEEEDPLEKARLRRELAEVNYDIANETVESLEERMARGEYVDPADYERALEAREEAEKQREETAKGLLEEERSKEMQAIERRRTELELRIANLEAAYANGDVSAEEYSHQQDMLRAETAVVDAEEAVVQEQLAQRKGQVEQAHAVQGELDQGFSTVTEAESRNAEEMGDGEVVRAVKDSDARADRVQIRENALRAAQAASGISEHDSTRGRSPSFQTAAIAGLGDTPHTAPEPAPAFDSVAIAGLGESGNGPTAEEPAAQAFESVDIAGLNEVEDNPPGPTPQAEPAKGNEKGKGSPTALS